MTGKLLSLGAVALALLLCVTFLSPIALAGDASAGNDLLRMGGGGGMGMGNKAMLGRHLYFDTNLSEPAGQSCASCHAPGAGWAEPDQSLPVSEGAVAGRFGTRNSPTSAYAAFSPLFSRTGTDYVGGQFWDGRAADLAEQAKGPFLNPAEMNNPSKAAVVNKVRTAMYSMMFTRVYGSNALNNVDTAYNYIADAIAAYEKSTQLNSFSSKYDKYVAGAATLTSQERQGLQLFTGKAKCSACHPTTATGTSSRAVFTNFRYYNLGVPQNTDYPFSLLNPIPIDYGLGGRVDITDPAQDGKFKTPTLRNVASSGPYLHNGYFDTLAEVVHFKNAGHVQAGWLPEVPQNVTTVIGNLGLSAQEETALVAFLKTLADSGCNCGM